MGDINFDFNSLGTVEKLSNGTLIYRSKQGRIHRNCGPAIINPNGHHCWYRHGKIHRKDGPAEINPDGTEKWYFNGNLHRVGGPAKIIQGVRYWYKFGLLHRVDGPAVEYDSGHVSWYLNDRMINSVSEFRRRSKCTDEELEILILKYGTIK